METYYDTAFNDFEYLQSIKPMIYTIGRYNPIAVTAQNIAERFLKHVIQIYLLDRDYTSVLRSHKLTTLYQAIHEVYPDFQLDKNMLRILTDYYIDALYPGADYITVSQQDALEAVEAVETIKGAVDSFIERHPLS